MTKKIVNLSLWLALVSPMTLLANNHEEHKSKTKCSCNHECKENCKAGKTKDCQCDGKSCECKNGKSCH